MLILGIETSCDETAVALVRDGREIVTSLVSSQIELHAPYGGVVPEVACRAHADWLPPMLDRLMAEAGIELDAIDAVAATARPGLIGALLIGLTAGKALAWSLGKPFIGVDHIEGHMHAPRMAHPDMPFPHLSLVVSGGHTEIWLSRDATRRELLAATGDDAAGECFDKAAALLGLGYPGGPSLERAAKGGNPRAIDFPRGQPGTDGMAMSFSGLKTAVLYHMQRMGFETQAGRPRVEQAPLTMQIRGTRTIVAHDALADIAASFQEAAIDMLVRPAMAACRSSGVGALTLTGGVAANGRLREKLGHAAAREGVDLYLTPPALCGDNAAFIAGAAHAYALEGRFDALDLDATPN